MSIRLAENFRAVFYAPFYGCLALGFFERLGLNIELVSSPSPGVALDWLRDDQVDVVWSGPQRSIKAALESRKDEDRLSCFGEVAAKDPFYLLTRADIARGFDLRSLPGLRLGVVSEVPTPWFCLRQDLLDIGIKPETLKVTEGMSMQEQLICFERGELDVIQVFEPYVQQAINGGLGQIAYAAADRGWTAYTTFMSTQRNINRFRAQFESMCLALADFSHWLNHSGMGALVEVVTPYYPDLDTDLLRKGLSRYDRAGLWSLRPAVSRAGYDRLLKSMLGAHVIPHAIPYEQVVADFAQES